MAMDRIKVLVVDDSAFMRKIISDLLAQDPSLEVVGAARDGLDALAKITAARPDVVTLDVEMPRMDGLQALKEIMVRSPLPVVMVSSLTQEGADTTIRALALGAVDFVGKPSGSISLDMRKVGADLTAKVKAAARAKIRPWLGALEPRSEPRTSGRPPGTARRLVVIGCSTGGPGALHRLIPELPGDLPAGVLVVQHMPPGFTQSLAARLNELSPLEVREASAGDEIREGLVLLAPGGFHMVVEADRTVSLNQDPPLHGVRPAADRTFESAVAVFGPAIVGAVLTGMGYDGARGTAAVKKAGGKVIAEHESTCVVYGMPRVVVEMGNADRVIPISEVAPTITELISSSASSAGSTGFVER